MANCLKMRAISFCVSDVVMINAPAKTLGLKRVLTPAFNNFKSPRPISNEKLFLARWQQRLAEQPLTKLKVRARVHFTINGTLLSDASLAKLTQQIETGKQFFNKRRYGFDIVVGKNRIAYAIYGTLKSSGGSTGKVELVQNLTDKQFYLVKTLSDCEEKASNESHILEQLGLLESQQSRTTKQGIRKTYLIIKIMPGFTLGTFKKLCSSNEETLSLQQQALIMLSMLEQMRELISRNILHDDITDENILIDPVSMKIKIIDFGDASIITKAGQHHQHYDLQKCYSLLKPLLSDNALTVIADKYIRVWQNLEQNLDQAIDEVRALCCEETCRKKL